MCRKSETVPPPDAPSFFTFIVGCRACARTRGTPTAVAATAAAAVRNERREVIVMHHRCHASVDPFWKPLLLFSRSPNLSAVTERREEELQRRAPSRAIAAFS